MAEYSDEIIRSLSRNKILPSSPLEKLIRENFYSIVGTSKENRDGKLDAFIAEQKGNAFYSDSFDQAAPPLPDPEPKIAISSEEELTRIAHYGLPGKPKAERQPVGAISLTEQQFEETCRNGLK